MQVDNTSLLKTAMDTFKKEGFFAYYKGVHAPLASVPFLNAIVFSSYEITRKSLEAHGMTGLQYVGVSGAVAGFLNSIIVGPTELIKCKMQVQKETLVYKSSLDCARNIVKENGWLGLGQGMYATIMREIPAYVGQFVMYEFLKRKFFAAGKMLGPAEGKTQKYSKFDFFLFWRFSDGDRRQKGSF